jgi:tetratricopeptide (TPR) repeat protein
LLALALVCIAAATPVALWHLANERELRAGERCFYARDYAAAVEHYQRIVAAYPAWWKGKTYLFAAQHEAQRVQDSGGQPVEPLAVDLRGSVGHTDRGYDTGHAGHPTQAIAEFQDALRRNPWNDWARECLAYQYHLLGREDDCIAELQRTIGIAPRNGDARFDLALALRDAGRIDEEIAQYRELLRQNPVGTPYHYCLACALGKQAKYDEAEAHLEVCLAANANDFPAREELIWAFRQSGHPDAAAAQCRELLRRNPKNAYARACLNTDRTMSPSR